MEVGVTRAGLLAQVLRRPPCWLVSAQSEQPVSSSLGAPGTSVKILNALTEPTHEYARAREHALHAKGVPCGAFHNSVHTLTLTHSHAHTYTQSDPGTHSCN